MIARCHVRVLPALFRLLGERHWFISEPVKVPASELIQAFVGEYRQLVVETRAIIDGFTRSGDMPCHLDVHSLASLGRLAHTLRDSGLFLGLPRLAAIARVLMDMLHVCDVPKTEITLTVAQAKLLVKGCHLADQIVESVEAQQREPSMEAELAGFAQAARTSGFSWEVQPFVRAPAEYRETLPEMSDAEKVERLLTEEVTPISSEAAPSAPGISPPAALADMVSIFVQDAEETLDLAEQNLLHLEAEPERINDLLRQFHTLKGNSGLMGYGQMQRISHGLEDVLQQARDRQTALGPDSVQLFLKAVDALRRCVVSMSKGGECIVPGYEDWLQRVDAWVGASSAEAPSPASVPETAPARPASTETPPAVDSSELAVPVRPAAQARDSIRITVERLDQLNDLTSELIVAAAVVMVAKLPPRALVPELVITPLYQGYA